MPHTQPGEACIRAVHAPLSRKDLAVSSAAGGMKTAALDLRWDGDTRFGRLRSSSGSRLSVGMPRRAADHKARLRERPAVLIISHQPTIRHRIERVCGYVRGKTVAAASWHDAHAIAAQENLRAFSLVVIDTADPAQEALYPTRMACRLLQAWTAASPLLPFLCLGPASQKHALLRIRADIVRFVKHL